MVEEVNSNFLFIISAPSGTGKTTLCRYLLGKHKNLVLSISATTRNPRLKETHGVDYFFLSKNEFEQKIDSNDFLEYAKVFDNYYGTPKSFVERQLNNEKNVLFDIDFQGMRKIKSQQQFNIVTLFLVPPSIEVLRQRLIGRGDGEEQVEKRVAGFKNDAEKANEYDFVIVNDDLNKACIDVENVYNASKLKFRKNKNLYFINNVLMK